MYLTNKLSDEVEGFLKIVVKIGCADQHEFQFLFTDVKQRKGNKISYVSNNNCKMDPKIWFS